MKSEGLEETWESCRRKGIKMCCHQQWLLMKNGRWRQMVGLLSSIHLTVRLQAEKLWHFLVVLGSLQRYIGELIKIISSPISAMLGPWYYDAN